MAVSFLLISFEGSPYSGIRIVLAALG